MELVDNPQGDPVEHPFEAELFEVKRHPFALALGQLGLVDPDPQIAQEQRYRHERQPQMWISCARINLRLTHLPVAGLDAKAFSISLSNLGRRAVHPPGA